MLTLGWKAGGICSIIKGATWFLILTTQTCCHRFWRSSPCEAQATWWPSSRSVHQEGTQDGYAYHKSGSFILKPRQNSGLATAYNDDTPRSTIYWNLAVPHLLPTISSLWPNGPLDIKFSPIGLTLKRMILNATLNRMKSQFCWLLSQTTYWFPSNYTKTFLWLVWSNMRHSWIFSP